MNDKKYVVSEIIEQITIRMEMYMDDITDCGGDYAMFESLRMVIEEDKFVLDLLVKQLE